MRFLTLCLVSLLFSSFAFAKMEGGVERTRVGAFYGYGTLSPNDVNNYAATQGNPADNKLSSFFFYGGQLAYMITPRIELAGIYMQQFAKNPVSNSLNSSAGVELSLNAFFAGLNYFLVNHGPITFSVGAFAGYPTYVHASVLGTTRTEYDSTFSPLAMGLADVNFKISNRFSIFIQGGYQYAMQSALSTGTNYLRNASTGNSMVAFDMSGIRALAGLNFHF